MGVKMAGKNYNLKLVIIGDGAVGKTCLLTRYVKNKFTDLYQPTIFENFVKEIKAGDDNVSLSLWDTAGQEGYESLRTVSYNADIYLIAYSCTNYNSLENAETIWHKELKTHDPKKPIILVGTKLDLKKEAETKTDFEKAK